MSRAVPKRRASSQERIDRILEATISLLGQGGLSELSIYAIAEQAEIPPSSVYHFFPQISDVLAALAERLFVELDAVLQQPPSSAPDSWAALVAEIEARFQDYYRRHPAACELLLGGHGLCEHCSVGERYHLRVGGSERVGGAGILRKSSCVDIS